MTERTNARAAQLHSSYLNIFNMGAPRWILGQFLVCFLRIAASNSGSVCGIVLSVDCMTCWRMLVFLVCVCSVENFGRSPARLAQQKAQYSNHQLLLALHVLVTPPHRLVNTSIEQHTTVSSSSSAKLFTGYVFENTKRER